MYTKEEIEAGIEAGDTDILNYVLSGETPRVEEPVIAEEEIQQEAVIETSSEPEVVVDYDKEHLREELDFFKAKYNEVSVKKDEPLVDNATAELQRQLDEQRKLVEQLTQQRETKPRLTISEDGEDDDLVDTYSRKNREYLKALADSTADTDTVLNIQAEVEKLKVEAAGRAKAVEDQMAQEAVKNQRRQLFDEVESFQRANNHFETPAPIGEMFETIADFKSRIGDFIKSKDNRVVEKAYRSIVNGKTTDAEKLRAEIAKVGISVPSGAEEFIKLAEIVDLKNGTKYNKVTGGFEDVTDSYGNKIMQRSIGDAFKLSTYSDRIVEATKQAARDVQTKLSNRENSATIMSNDNTSGSEDGKLSAEAINGILNSSSRALMSDPELNKKYNQAMTQLGLA